MVSVYVADDDKNIRDLIASFLIEEGFDVSTFETGDQLLLAFMEQVADVVILDVMMPGTDGFAISRKLREYSEVPIILLTARDSDVDFLEGFSSGADDYFTKPFSPLKLALRVRAIASRLPQGKEKPSLQLSYGKLRLSDKDRTVYYDQTLLKLTNTEFQLLHYLLEHKEGAVSRNRLLQEIWGYESEVETRVTDDTIKRLRKKLREVGSHVLIETVWGYGFKLVQKD